MSEEQKSEQIYVAENADAQADTIFGTAPETVSAAPQKGMSRNAKWLIAGICAVVLLGGGVTAAVLLGGKEAEESSAAELTEAITLNDSDMDTVKTVEIRSEESFTLRCDSTGEDGARHYVIDGYEDLEMDSNLLSTLLRNGSGLEADSLVAEKAEADPAIFGLAEPRADVTMTYEDGSTFSFRIGDPAPTGNAQTYCEVDGDIYLIRNSLVASYVKTPIQFVSATVLAEPEQAVYPIVQNVRIERKDLDYDICIEYDKAAAEDDSVGGTASTHVMTSPTYAYLSPDKSVGVTNGMLGLTALEVTAVHPTDADLAQAGLKDPACTVEMELDSGERYTLYIGDAYISATGAECYYAAFGDVPVIYGLTKDDAQWMTVVPGDITSASVFVTMVWNIGTLDIHTSQGDFLFEGEGSDRDSYVVTKNGQPCDTERFRKLYHFLLSIYGEEMYYDEVPAGEPDAEIHLVSQNGKDDYTVSFYKLSEMKSLVSRDGTSYVIRTSCLNMLLHNLEILDDPDQEISLTWQ